MAKTYQDKLKDPRWQRKRLKVLERDGWKCVVCYDNEDTLHVHHTSYRENPWEAPDECLVTLCQVCHESEHDCRRDYERDLIEILQVKGFLAADLHLIINGFKRMRGQAGSSEHVARSIGMRIGSPSLLYQNVKRYWRGIRLRKYLKRRKRETQEERVGANHNGAQ